ncbi:PilW family protein [Thaumasiovibrio subtropicus]|uniref:PilW family protein n=1 Tax=Thaumasiovibrio subtropicus TaxID=1891207 RepID=UPI000B34FCC6|nr:prepilin-type N-terminal cleavage/methylation domain-containing protein [Thaumasiovibrio subtropicus]
MLSAKKQRGMSLVELTIASAISLIAIGAVGSVYISGHKAAYGRTQQLVLRQEVNDALRVVTEEMARAGYSTREKSIKLSGASNVVGIHRSGNAVDFVYAKTSTAWRTMGFSLKPRSAGVNAWLKICLLNETPGATSGSASTLEDFCYSQSGGSDSLLNKDIIEVNSFTVSEEVISSANGTSQKLTVYLKATMPSISESYEKEKSIVLRNWR